MANLGEHYDEAGGTYLPEGDHLVKVKAIRFFTYNSGNAGAEYVLADARDREIKLAFSLMPKALWVLASFAKACGLSREQCNAFDTDNLGSHQRYMIGRKLNVHVIKGAANAETGKQYSEVDKEGRGWWPVDSEWQTHATPAANVAAAIPATANPATAQGDEPEEQADNDLPF
jgi:hypothetical protein